MAETRDVLALRQIRKQVVDCLDTYAYQSQALWLSFGEKILPVRASLIVVKNTIEQILEEDANYTKVLRGN